MEIISIIFLAIGLSMDSMAIALTSGAVIGNHRLINVLKIAGMLAFTQMILTVIGWFVGSTFARYIDEYDHWVAFAILTFLGMKMIIEGVKNSESEESKKPFNPLNINVMFGLALATSIDATAVGMSLSIVNRPILFPAIIIGLVTLIVSIIGVVFGSKVGRRYNLKINVLGGIILIIIGCVILSGHTLGDRHEMLSLF